LFAEFVDYRFSDIFCFVNVSKPGLAGDWHTGRDVVITYMSAFQTGTHSLWGRWNYIH